MSEPLNIRDSYVLTRTITKTIRSESFRGGEVSPLVPSQMRKFKMTVREADQPFGIGQFKAPNQDTPIADIKGQFNATTTTYISAVDMEEMVVLEETDKLESADALVKEAAIDDIIRMGQLLQLRNERLTEFMRWKAFMNALTITFPNGDAVAIDSYGSFGTGANKHVLGPSDTGNSRYREASWNDVDNSKPLNDLLMWADLVENDSGFTPTHMWISRATFRKFQQSAQWAEYLTFVDRQFRLVTEQDIARLSNIPNIHVYEGAYKDNDGTSHRYLPEGYILLTTAPVVDGLRISETYDCPVVRAVNNRLVVSRNPGLDAEIFVDPLKKQEFLRVSSARMTHVMLPECMMYVYVGD